VVGLPEGRLFVIIEIIYVLGIAFLMASRIPHFSGKQIGRVKREYFIVVLFAVAVFILALASFPMEVLIALTLSYLGLLPLAIRRHARFSAETQAAEAGASTALEPPPAP
jgi:CDP-diacylglycerol--serine O-phosphatidyltransferase